MASNAGSPFPPRNLPLGVAVLAILIGIVGFFFVLGGILLLVLHFALPGSGALFLSGWVGEVLLVIFGIVLLAVATGLWDRSLWALALTVLVLVLILLSNVVSGALLSLSTVVVVVLLVYLILVREHFE